MAATTTFLTSIIYVFTSLLSVVSAVGTFLASLLTALPFILVFLAMTLVMLPWVKYHDNVGEEAEFFMRTQVYPLWRDTIRAVASLLRDVYNPTICWWNAANWWGYGMTRFVLWPTIRDCGVGDLFRNAGELLLALAEELVIPIVSTRFFTEDIKFTKTTPAGVALAESWITLYTCSCSDLACVVRVIPILNPLIVIPPVWGILVPFSQQWADPQLWCAIESAVNVVITFAREVLVLIQQILLLISGQQTENDPFIRPEFRDTAEYICSTLFCFARSTETVMQAFWDKFVPFKFVWADYLCLADSLLCIAVKTIALVIRFLVNIDKAVVYPTDPFWEAVIKQDVIELINLWAAPTDFSPILVPSPPNAVRFTITTYFLDPAVEATLLGTPNPIFGKKRVTECLCTFITRTICDPSDENSACFSEGAQNLLMGFDFCCLTTSILNTLADAVASAFEFTLHLSSGPDQFFLFIDEQPFTTHFKQKLTVLVRCALSVFGLIPEVGTSIRDLIAGIIEYLLCLIDFFIRVIFGLATLPYFIIVLPGIPNFLQNANEALDFFVEIHDKLIADTPSSVKNALCVILNKGFPIPPIPCSSCNVGGFVTPPAFKRRRLLLEKDGSLFSPVTMLSEIWGEPTENDAIYHMTPMLQYGNQTSNPVKLANMIMVNAQTWASDDFEPFLRVRDMDQMMNEKQERLMERWARVKRCNSQTRQAKHMRATNERLFYYHVQKGDFDCLNDGGHMLPMMPPYGQDIEAGLDNVSHYNQERLTLGPLEPNVTGCSNPEPECFDLCCTFRTLLEALIQLIKTLARFFNGLIQGSASLQGTMQDFPYFTGEFCEAPYNEPCFQSDIVDLILAFFRPFKCLCQAINLIIPVTPEFYSQGRPDLCCAIQRVSELIACIVQVIFQTINALALGSQDDFAYFRGAGFRNDVNVLFDITLAVVDCLCIFLNAIFPLNFIPGFKEAVDFDPCCIPAALITTLIEILRGILQVIITLATITIDDSAYCYWRLDKTLEHDCSGDLDKIGMFLFIISFF